MKFSINTDILKNSINTLVKIGGKEIGGLEENILIICDGENVFLNSNGNDIGLEYKLKIIDGEKGEMLVPGQTIDGVVESLVNNKTDIKKDGNRVIISTEISKSKINTLPQTENKIDFPKIENVINKSVVEKDILINGFRMVSHAAAVGVVKPELGSVSMYTKDGSIYFVATDTFRLSEVRFSTGVDSDFNILIPIKNINKILKVLEGCLDTKINLSVSKDKAFFSTEGGNEEFKLYTRLIDASFPDYKNLINQKSAKEAVVLKSDILNFFKKAKFFSNKLNRIKINFEDNDVMVLSFENESAGSTEDRLPVVDVVGNSEIPSFNYKFLMDAISVIRDDRVHLKFVGSVNSVLIRGVKDQSFTAVISPLIG